MKPVLIFIAALLLSACTLGYKEIQQGNIIEPHKAQQVKAGMSKTRVMAIMGTPLLYNSFSPNRWEYVHLQRKGSGPIHKQKVIVNFVNNRVSTVRRYLS
jgi:outer membrane protein assembly factor BamE